MSVKENTEIDWFCDNCGEQLNNQSGFDRSDGCWVCEMLNMIEIIRGNKNVFL